MSRDRRRYFYLAAVAAVLTGTAVGLAAPEAAVEPEPLGEGLIALIMMISPVVFCTIVLGVGSVRNAAKVGTVGGLVLAYFLTVASLFVAEATGGPVRVGEQVSLFLFVFIASEGAAGVTGAGLATPAGGPQSYRSDLVDGLGLIVGDDRFVGECRALTDFAGNAVATVPVGTWTKRGDKERLTGAVVGRRPFDGTSMLGAPPHEPAERAPDSEPAEPAGPAAQDGRTAALSAREKG